MSQIDELQSRITVALEKIGTGLDAVSKAAEDRGRLEAQSDIETKVQQAAEQAAADARAEMPVADPEEIARLRTELEEERLANAQLEARVKTLKDKLASQQAPQETAQPVDLLEALARLDQDLARLRTANEKLSESNAALRDANAEGVGEPHLINSAMLAELEALRALRASEASEASSIMEQLVPLLNTARNLPEGEDA